MAKKKKILPDEILQIIEEVKEKQHEEDVREARELVQQYRTERANSADYWDIKKDDEITFFDKRLSYELTGYRPIDETHGLDFDPSWFTQTRDIFHRTGHYCSYLPGSKRYLEFWKEQYRRCRDGLTVNGYTITGDHYFFLNFYLLPITHSAEKAGGGRRTDFPEFYVAQYEFFHYFELAKRLRKHAVLMKARGVGFSEINASIAACAYTVIRNSVTMVTCYDKGKLDRTLSKDWNALKFLDTHTDGGMFKLRLLSDTALVKKSGHYLNDRGGKIPAGWLSMIEGVVADDPQKIRGDRVDTLIFDECFAPGTKVIMSDYSIKNIEDIQIGEFVLGIDGTPQEVMNITTGEDSMYLIKQKHKMDFAVNSKHKLYIEHRPRTGGKADWRDLMTVEEYRKLSNYNIRTSFLLSSNGIDNLEDKCEINPYYLGAWLGDGSQDLPSKIIINKTKDSEIYDYIKDYFKEVGDYSERPHDICKDCIYLYGKTSENLTKNVINNQFKKYDLINNKYIPTEVFLSTLNYKLQVLAGLIDTDGNVNKKCYEIVMSRKELILLIKMLAESCGFDCLYSERVSTGYAKGKTMAYRVTIKGNISIIPVKIQRKKVDFVRQTTVNSSSFLVEDLGVGTYYGITLKSYGKKFDNLFYLEDFTIVHNCGSWPKFRVAFIQAEALVAINGVRFGIKLAGGTGGDSGPNLEGLKDAYYNPDTYDVLPFYHNYTQDGAYIYSGYFIPAYAQVHGYIDKRGYCNHQAAKEFYQKERDKMLGSPKALISYSAEYCFNAEEAFALEGDNKFNKVNIANQLAEIRLHKRGPRPVAGYIDYFYKNSKHTADNIDGYKWIPNPNGKVQILEHPVWSELYKENIEKLRKEAEEKGEKFDMPIYNEMNNLYVAGIDGIDIGANLTSKETKDPSDFCIVILRRAFGMNDPQIVAMYKDRPGDIREAFKIAMCLARYYNAKINIEATRMSMVNWARDTKQLLYFMKRPRATLTDVKYGTTKLYGTPATKTIIEQHTDLTAAFVEDYCHTIWFEEILELLTSYNDENKGKFDIVAALGMTFLADLELSGRLPVNVVQEVELFQDFGYYIDGRGYKRFGVIPRLVLIQLQFNEEEYYDPYRIESSDPRVYEYNL